MQVRTADHASTYATIPKRPLALLMYGFSLEESSDNLEEDRIDKLLLIVKVKIRLRPTVSRPVYFGVKPPSWTQDQSFVTVTTVAGLLMCGALFDDRTGLLFITAAGLRQRSRSQIRVPHDSWPYFTASDSRLLQPGGPGSRIYIHQEQGGPVISPGTGFPYRRLLRLAGPRCRYSNPSPHGDSPHFLQLLCYVAVVVDRIENITFNSS
jgi:hypothetical protein